MTSEMVTRLAQQYLHRYGSNRAFDQVVDTLVQTSQARNPDFKEIKEEFIETLEETLSDTWQQAAEKLSRNMGKPYVKGTQSFSKGFSSGEYGDLWTNVELTYPEYVTYVKSVQIPLTDFVQKIIANNWISRLGLTRQPLVTFFQHRASQNWLSSTWAEFAQQNLHDFPTPYYLTELGEDAVHNNVEEDIETTRYTEEGDVPAWNPDIEYTIYLKDPTWKILDAQLKSGKFFLKQQLTFPVGNIHKITW